jgi:RNA polymerase sigma-70 factor (ECF subfamily)
MDSHGTRPSEATRLLREVNAGNEAALESLLTLVYDELRRLAASYLARERPNHTLQATALVHEAFLRLVDQRAVEWQNRGHFFAVAAQAMRRILVDHARARGRLKRNADAAPVETIAVGQEDPIDLLALDLALTRLAARDARLGTVVELRFFAGLTVEETAEALDLSPASVKRDWQTAKAWLRKEMM